LREVSRFLLLDFDRHESAALGEFDNGGVDRGVRVCLAHDLAGVVSPHAVGVMEGEETIGPARAGLEVAGSSLEEFVAKIVLAGASSPSSP
jgi:hypothetical protein